MEHSLRANNLKKPLIVVCLPHDYCYEVDRPQLDRQIEAQYCKSDSATLHEHNTKARAVAIIR